MPRRRLTLVLTLAYKLVEVESEPTGQTVTYVKVCRWSAHCLTCMQRKRHRHLATHRPSWKRRLALLYTLAEKKTLALIYTLEARLTKVQVKTVGDTVSTMEMEALVET